ncbi:MAG: hypothetical protein ACYTAN_06455 [Planctomycetota bacterium]|jgi:hypothetical protein
MDDLALITWKELSHMGGRGRFHLEKALFAFAVAAAVGLIGFRETALDTSALREAAEFGRTAFFMLMMATVAVVCAVSLVTASGVILSERLGGRLDVLRVTSISLPVIVAGKGLAVFGRAMLIAFLVLPVAAATQLFGGVGLSEIAKAFLVTAAAVFFCSSLGLLISSSSTSALDRAVKLFNVALIAGAVGWYAGLKISSISPSVSWVAGLSPFLVWGLLRKGALTWSLLVLNVGVYGGGGLVLVAVSAAKRALDVEADRPKVEAPTAREVIDYAGDVTKKARWRLQLSRFRRIFGSGARVGGVIGQLVAIEVRRTSIVTLLMGPLLLVPWLVTFIAALFARGVYVDAVESVQVGTELLAAGVILAVLLESCSSMAREKMKRTGGLLALTPMGGPAMALWKGAAILAAQSIAISICAVMTIISGIARSAGVLEVAADLAGFGSAVIFALVAGMSFSLASKTAIRAGAALAFSVLVLVPFILDTVFSAISGKWGEAYTPFYLFFIVGGAWTSRAISVPLDRIVLLSAAVGLWFGALRQVTVKGATVILSVSLAAVIASILCLLGAASVVEWESKYANWYSALTFLFSFWRGIAGATLGLAAAKVVAATALAAGMAVNFRRMMSVEIRARR